MRIYLKIRNIRYLVLTRGTDQGLENLSDHATCPAWKEVDRKRQTTNSTKGADVPGHAEISAWKEVDRKRQKTNSTKGADVSGHSARSVWKEVDRKRQKTNSKEQAEVEEVDNEILAKLSRARQAHRVHVESPERRWLVLEIAFGRCISWQDRLQKKFEIATDWIIGSRFGRALVKCSIFLIPQMRTDWLEKFDHALLPPGISSTPIPPPMQLDIEAEKYENEEENDVDIG